MEVRSSRNNRTMVFTMALTFLKEVCLTYENGEISVERFTELALRGAFFPR